MSVLALAVSQAIHAQEQLQEIVITAQKREQSLQDVPLSVSAFDETFIEQASIKDIRDVGGLTPGLSIKSRGDTEASVFIRGIGSQAPGIGADPAVGIFVDGVSVSRGTNATAAFFDIERVEVVKGPQGTLFGRNASAGAISIITKRPDLTENSLYVMAGAGDEGQVRYQAIGNWAVSDRFGLRLGVNHDERDGLYKNSVTGEELLDKDNTNIRLGAYFLPTDNWQSYLTVERFELENFDTIVNDDDAFKKEVAQNARPGKQTLEYTRAAWDNKWDIGSLTLSSLTGFYTHDVRVTPVDADMLDVPLMTFVEPQTNDSFSQEFRLSGATAAIDWFVGASYSREKLEFTTDLNYDEEILVSLLLPEETICQDEPGICQVVSETPSGKNTTDSYAVFGDATWQMSDAFALTAGFRYTRDEKDMTYDSPATQGLLGLIDGQIFGPITDGPVSRKDEWSSFDPRVALDWYVADDVSLYLSVARGYKSGGINRQVNDFLPNEQVLNAFDKEVNTAYEAGLKSRFWAGRAQLNAAVFFNDYKDFQLETQANLVPEVFNVGDIETKGLEVEGRFLLTDSLEVGLNVGLLDTEVTRSVFDSSLVGNETPQAPKTSGSLFFGYYLPVGTGELNFSGNWQYSSRYWFDIFNTLEQPSYNVVNLRLGYQAAQQRWGIAVVGENVTDEAYYTERFFFLDNSNRRAPGALWRVELSAKF
jgi:iron complex outermembrane receptor protein